MWLAALKKIGVDTSKLHVEVDSGETLAAYEKEKRERVERGGRVTKMRDE